MPKLRSRQGPIIKCARPLCDVTFRKWRKRLFCCDDCKKKAWREAHRPYYNQQRTEQVAREKKARRQRRIFQWVEEGKENKTPERISLAEVLAQASPQAIAEIQELLGQELNMEEA